LFHSPNLHELLELQNSELKLSMSVKATVPMFENNRLSSIRIGQEGKDNNSRIFHS